MIGKTNLGGSGGGLNFKVVGGTSVPAGHENLVWVNTETAISSWVVSPNEPQAPAEGMVWILDGDSNGINIIKKNAVEVFPSQCHQFISGGWADVEAFLFHAAAWVKLYAVRPITLTVVHPKLNDKYINITIVDQRTGDTVSAGRLDGVDAFAAMTDADYSFAYRGKPHVLRCSVRSNPAPFFSAVMLTDGVIVSEFSGGTGSNSSYAWSFTQDGFM